MVAIAVLQKYRRAQPRIRLLAKTIAQCVVVFVCPHMMMVVMGGGRCCMFSRGAVRGVVASAQLLHAVVGRGVFPVGRHLPTCVYVARAAVPVCGL